MGEAVGHGVAAAALLQAVVAHGFGGVEGFFQVALLKQLACLRAVGPYTGQAVGLQLHHHGEAVGIAFVHAGAGTVYALHGAVEVLHVVADFMGNHIGKSRITRRAELVFHIVVEREVEVNLLVGWAVERAHCRLAGTAGGGGAAAIQHHFRLHILPALAAEIFAPGVFGGSENLRGELCQLLFFGADGTLLLLLHLRHLHAAAGEAAQIHAVIGADEHDNQAGEAHFAAAAPTTSAAAKAATVFDVAAAALVAEFHIGIPWVGVVGRII